MCVGCWCSSGIGYLVTFEGGDEVAEGEGELGGVARAEGGRVEVVGVVVRGDMLEAGAHDGEECEEQGLVLCVCM